MLSLFRPRLTPRLLTLRPTTRYLTNKPGPNADEAASESKIQSKNEVKPRSSQNTGSGTNDEIAGDKSAYNPRTTNPVTEKSEVGEEVCAFSSPTHPAEEQPDYAAIEWPAHFGTSLYLGGLFTLYGA